MVKQSLKALQEADFRRALADAREGRNPAGFSSLEQEDMVRITSDAVKAALRYGIRLGDMESAFKQVEAANNFSERQFSSYGGSEYRRAINLVDKAGISLLSLANDGMKSEVMDSVIKGIGAGGAEYRMVEAALAKKKREYDAASTV